MKDSGYIDLYFGDQSHFGLTPNVPYTWQTKDNSVLLPAAKGKYQNVVGLMTRKNKLYFEMLESTLIPIELSVLWIVLWSKTIKKTVVILDNSPIHKSKKFMANLESSPNKELVKIQAVYH